MSGEAINEVNTSISLSNTCVFQNRVYFDFTTYNYNLSSNEE
jgi:hypothetical protein